jgi:SAM-dependent methyltransferase
MTSADDLTLPSGWDERHKDHRNDLGYLTDAREFPWMSIVREHLTPYKGGTFLELGCVPGRISSLICSEISLRPEGVDFCAGGQMYVESLATVGSTAVYHHCDLREFFPPRPFDIVGSFGLVEHFTDVGDIVGHQDRLLRKGGLCIIEVPNFTRSQYLYHWLFDRPNLVEHNTGAMNLKLYERLARQYEHEILHLGYSGRLRFWGENPNMPKWMKRLSRTCRRYAEVIAPTLPENNGWFSPWLLYVARKR